MHNACLSGNAKVVRELLRAKADPNALDSKKSAPVHEAAKGGHFEVIQVLSGFGAKFDVYDVLENNPIHYAASANAGTAIRFLGQRGEIILKFFFENFCVFFFGQVVIQNRKISKV